MLKAIVAVGKSSVIRLRDAVAYRAISPSEVTRYLESLSGIDIVIYEEPSRETLESIGGIEVPIAVLDSVGNSRVEALCVERGYAYTHSVADLQDAIESLTGKSVATHVRDEKEIVEDDNLDDDIAGLFTEGDAEDTEVTEKRHSMNAGTISSVLNVNQYTAGDTQDSDQVEVVITSKAGLTATTRDDESLLDSESEEALEEEDTGNEERVAELLSEIDSLKSQLSASYETIESLSSERESVESEYRDIKARVEKLFLDTKVTEVVIGGVDIEDYEQKIADLESELDNLRLQAVEVEELKRGLSELTEKVALKEREEVALRQEIETLRDNSEAEGLKVAVADSLSDRETVAGLLRDAVEALTRYEKEAESLKSNAREASEYAKELKGSADALRTEISTLRGIVSEKEHRLIEQGEDSERRISALTASRDSLNREINRLKGELSGSSSLRERLEATESALKTRDSEVASLRGQLSSGVKELNIKFRYGGRASLVPVFGGSSSGITATAVTIAKQLKGRTLLIDLDIVSPKVDSYLGVNPIKSGLDIQNQLLRTGLGSYLERGLDYFIVNKREIITKITKRTDGTALDYLSGLYTSVSADKFITNDLGRLLDYLGGDYDYIVCDLGKIAGNEVQNQIIGSVCAGSGISVCVSQNDKSDARSLALRISGLSLKGKLMWVLNFARSREMDGITSKCVGKSKYAYMMFDAEGFGARQTLDMLNGNREAVAELVREVSRE
jgi:Mrp family chromosome partitioning ATPase